MEYNLIKINRLDGASVLKDGDYIVADVNIPSPDGTSVYASKRIDVKNAFATDNIRLSNASSISVDLNDDIFQDPDFKDIVDQLSGDLISQDDANYLFTIAIQALMKKVKELPNIIMHPGPHPPPIENDSYGDPMYPVEGSLWIDTNTFKQYVYFYDRDLPQNPRNFTRRWIALTDR